MDRKPRTLSDAEIVSQRAVTRRRTLLSTLGIVAGLAAVAAAGAHAQTTEPRPKPPPERRDPCRDSDHGPPSDTDGCGKPPIS